MNKLFFPTLAAAGLLFGACQVRQTGSSNTEHMKIIEYYTGPCFGNCPVYTLSVFNDGTARYDGRQLASRQGIYTKTLDESTLSRIQQAFRSANLWQYPDTIPSRVPDYAQVRFSFTDNGKTKTVSGKEDLPTALVNLQGQMRLLANADDWELLEKPSFGLPNYVIPDEIIVQLQAEADAQQWVTGYQRQYASLKAQLSRSMNIWLFRFDPYLTEPEHMLQILEKDPQVETAEFNKELGERR